MPLRCRATCCLPWPDVRDQLNRLLRGWQAYFGYGTLAQVYSDADWCVANRVRHFLRRRRQRLTQPTSR